MKLAKKLRRWKRNLRLIWRPTERQLWAAYRLGRTARSNEVKREGLRFIPMLCSTCAYTYTQKASPAQMSAYDQPDKTTDPLKAAKYVERIRTQHELPKLPKLTRDLRKYHLQSHNEQTLTDEDIDQAQRNTW